ncbi:nucleoside/nucleotide kinase family protein [Grimontia hollisae]|uniref:hypothetical protein n=1 Tax=Grimontia hollisae TaxID=673 RepID=UPI001303E8C1|nr:hypothetical protein [Grimontia hollisae]
MIDSIISEIIDREDLRVIVFDGFSGSGKTTTAKSVAYRIQGIAIDTDDYVKQKDGGTDYLNCLDLNSLSSDLDKALGEVKRVCLSGICIQELCERLNINVDYKVYIKKLSENTEVWNAQYDIEDYRNDPSSLEGGSPIHVCDMKYHLKYEPHVKADKIVEIVPTG